MTLYTEKLILMLQMALVVTVFNESFQNLLKRRGF